MDKIIEWVLLDEKTKKRIAISIKEIFEKLLLEPFSVKDKKLAYLMARYLVEDNND